MTQKPVEDITQVIGNTSVVGLKNVVDEGAVGVYVRLEYQNPGDFIEDRIALTVIEEVEKEGRIKPGDTTVGPISGNTGIGLAFICAIKGYKVVLTVSETVSPEHHNLLKIYDAKSALTPGSEVVKGVIKKARGLEEERGYFELQQFENSADPEVYALTTSPKLVEQSEGKQIDALLADVGTGGTLSSAGKALKRRHPNVEIVTIGPEGSSVLSSGEPGPHRLQGLGTDFVPDTLNTSIYDSIIKVGNETVMETSRRMAKKEGILAGIPSDVAIHATIEKAKELGKGKTVITVLPSNDERYLSTPLYPFDD